MKTTELTAVIITKNEAEMLPACLETLHWCHTVVVLDDGSSDETSKLAEKKGAQVIQFSHSSFARLRNEALKYVKTPWVLYIDADERITPTLAKEIMVQIETSSAVVMQMNRKNIFLGQFFEYGGWEKDTVTRIFYKDSLKEWHGKIHETPEFVGETVLLKTPLIHFSHRSIVSGLYKSASWTAMEAELLHAAKIPTVTIFTILRKGIMEFIRRSLLQKGYKDGSAGLVEAVVQGINRMLVYAQVWELQQKPPIADKYTEFEAAVQKEWSDQE